MVFKCYKWIIVRAYPIVFCEWTCKEFISIQLLLKFYPCSHRYINQWMLLHVPRKAIQSFEGDLFYLGFNL